MGWREHYPRRWQREQDELAATGWKWWVASDGRPSQVVIELEVPAEAGTLLLRAEYPDAYPYFVPQVFAPHGTFARHQNPATNVLCLLGRHGEDWDVANDTLASLLREQFGKIAAVNRPGVPPDEVAQTEDHAGEPLSIFVPCAPDSAILVPDVTPPPDSKGGTLTLARLPKQSGAENALRAVLRQVVDASGRLLAEFDLELPTADGLVTGHWMRLPGRPASEAVNPLFLTKMALSELPRFSNAVRNGRHGDVLVLGFVYEDEGSWRENRDDWLFVEVHLQVQKRPRKVDYKTNFVRADWAGKGAALQRAPFLAPLAEKRALIVGLGSLGSPVVMQLARAGVGHLDVLDSDHLQSGNSVRWALGLESVGLDKTLALAQRVQSEYPRVSVVPHRWRVGIDTGAMVALEQLVKEADLVVDAAASHPLSALLSDLCWALQRPYLWLTTTPGARSGAVGRVVRQGQGCWHCYVQAMTSGDIPTPLAADERAVQPGGCGQPTFIGAALDSDEIALLASRLAVATLSQGAEEGYPDFEWQVAIGHLFQGKSSMVPSWTTHTIEPRVDCPLCGGS